MSSSVPPSSETAPQVILWMPIGRDSKLAEQVLKKAGISAESFESVAAVQQALSGEQVGLAILAEEALTPDAIQQLSSILASQPPWSDLPLILLTGGGNSTGASLLRLSRMRPLGNMTLLERPLRSVTLVAAVRTAMASRLRQFQTRDYIRKLEDAQDRLAQANADLKQFAFAASHDLKEPLRMVNIFTKLLMDRHVDRTNSEARQFADYVATGVSRMESLLHDLLHYSRAIHEEISWPIAKVRLADAIESSVQALTPDIEAAGADIQYADLPEVDGDQMQLSLVFQNLISNSIKYRRKGIPPAIRISAEVQDDQVQVTVQDNGIGFDQRYAERVFELFQRLNTTDVPGTGLGLAICRRIVERHRGRIWAESRVGEGARFMILLPASGRGA